MARKIKIDAHTSMFGIVDLVFNENEHCLSCPQCGELIEDGDDNDDNS